MYSPSLLSKTWAIFFQSFGPVASRLPCCSKQSPIVNLPIASLSHVYPGCGPSSFPAVTRGPDTQHPEHLHFFSTQALSPCLYFWYLNICTDTHLFLKIFSQACALRRADISARSNPSSSTYSPLCEIANMHAVARRHLWLSQAVCSTSSTWISFQPRSVANFLFGIQTHVLTIIFLKIHTQFQPRREGATGL